MPGAAASQSRREASTRAGPSQCLSKEPHQINYIEDIQCHIFGCIPISARPGLMHDMEDGGFWHKALAIDRKEDLRIYGMQPRMPDSERRKFFIRYIAALGIQAERRRTEIIRKDGKNGPSIQVQNVTDSLAKWRQSDEYKEGLKWVKKRNHASARDGHTKESKDSEVEDEVKKAEEEDMLFAKALTEIVNNYQHTFWEQEGQQSDLHSPTEGVSPEYNLEKDFKVHILQFEPLTPQSRNQDDPVAGDINREGLMQPYQEQEGLLHAGVYKGEFPDQVMTIEKFFSQEFRRMVTLETCNHGNREGHSGVGAGSDPCLKTTEKSRRVRWFHIPHNNMQVIDL